MDGVYRSSNVILELVIATKAYLTALTFYLLKPLPLIHSRKSSFESLTASFFPSFSPSSCKALVFPTQGQSLNQIWLRLVTSSLTNQNRAFQGHNLYLRLLGSKKLDTRCAKFSEFESFFLRRQSNIDSRRAVLFFFFKAIPKNLTTKGEFPFSILDRQNLDSAHLLRLSLKEGFSTDYGT
ncbi:hypothetical protein RRG08_011813 [Elysia crispata]|uniref:Uncharacterized protein n=1 Tax=Elysia crispata TaxID=231223 RepID=A0AAE1D0G9_9GAST|nr:hypothetical protein RRG08_011813 [Elysia crispata]